MLKKSYFELKGAAMPVLFVTLALVLTFNVTLVFAEQKPFNLKPITENLGIVWGMSIIDDSSLIFTQRVVRQAC